MITYTRFLRLTQASTVSCMLLAGCIGPITSVPLNQPPTANAGTDINAQVGQRVTLNGQGSTDADDDPLTFSWEQRSGPAVVLDNPNSAQSSFVPTQDGTYEFALTVTDGRGGSDTSTVTVFVGDDAPSGQPFADAGVDQTLNEGAVVTLRGGNSADPDGDTLDFFWRQIAGLQVSLSNVFAAEPTFVAPEVAGDTDLQFELTVTDPSSLADTDIVTVTVHDLDVAGSPCSGVTCPSGQFCDAATGDCVTQDLCATVSCPSGQTCNAATGQCEGAADLCAGVTCLTGQSCDPDTGLCEVQDLCASVTCLTGHSCDPVTGQCEDVDLCANVTCQQGEECDELTGACAPIDLCAGVSCPTDETCDSDTGMCKDPLVDLARSIFNNAFGNAFTVLNTAP